MGKGMQETNTCSRQESGNVEEAIVPPPPPPPDSAGSGYKHTGRRWGRRVRKVTPERQTELCSIFAVSYIYAGTCFFFSFLRTNTGANI